jgi:hypothetical protein
MVVFRAQNLTAAQQQSLANTLPGSYTPTNPDALSATSTQLGTHQGVGTSTKTAIPSTNATSVDKTTSSTSPSATSDTAAQSSGPIAFSPTQNPLNSYANYTYHLRLFMVSDYDAANLNATNVDDLTKIIIAESGVTSQFNITSCDITNTCGPNVDGQNTSTYHWTMTIVEAYGMSLIDKIYAGAQALGISNHLKSIKFLDVWFTGYDNDGNIIKGQDVANLRKTYSVMISDMDLQADENGTTYNITGFMQDQVGLNDLYVTTQDKCHIIAKNVAEFFQQFGDKLTNQQYNLVAINGTGSMSPKVKYIFRPPAGSDKWLLQDPKKILKSNQRNADMNVSVIGNSVVFQIAKGQSFNNIVTYVLSCSPDAVQAVLGKSSQYNLTSNGLSQFFMLHSNVTNIGYDYTSNDYIREIVYSVYPHVIATRVVPDVATAQVIQNSSVQTAKINKLIDSNLINKWYQYIYTGENTEVISFQIEMDAFWSTAILSSGAAYIGYDEWTVGPTLAPGTPGYDNIKHPPAPTTTAAAIQSSSPATPDQQPTTTPLENLINGIKKNHGIPPASTTANPSAGQQAISGASSTNAATQYDTLVYFNQHASNLKQTKNAENLSNVSENDIWPLTVTTSNVPYATFTTQNSTASRTDSTDGTNALGRGAFGIIAGNLYSQNYFAQIDLEVRGDPYWLGLSNIEQNSYVDALVIPQATTTTSTTTVTPTDCANFVQGANMFLLTFRTGEQINEDTGLMEFNQTSNHFSGFYSVTSCVNHFKDGLFTQTLTATKDTFSQGVNVNAAQPAQSNTTATATSTSTTTPTTNTVPANRSVSAAITSTAKVAPNVPTFGPPIDDGTT